MNCESCERMTRAETEIKNLKEVTGDVDQKVDQLILEVARMKATTIALQVLSPLAVGLIVYFVTRGAS